MATIEMESYRVVTACDEGIKWVENYRKEQLAEAIKKAMSATRFSFREFGRVPAFLSESDALAAFKGDDKECYGYSTYDWIMCAGKKTEEALVVLRGMARKAITGRVHLSTKDYELIRAYL